MNPSSTSNEKSVSEVSYVNNNMFGIMVAYFRNLFQNRATVVVQSLQHSQRMYFLFDIELIFLFSFPLL